MTEFSKGDSSLTGALSLGVLDEVKGTVCYAAQMVKARIANTGDVTLVSLSAITAVGDQPIVLQLWTNYRDASSIATGLASLKTIYSDFAAANGKIN